MRSFFIVLMTCCSWAAYSQVDTVTVRKLSTAWISHDQQGEAFQVFDASKVSVGGFYVSEREIREGLLRICGPEYDLWVDGRLVRYASSGCTYFTPYDIFGDLLVDTAYCTVISPLLEEVEVDLQTIRPAAERYYDLPGERLLRASDNAWWLLMLLVLVLLSILRVADDQTYRAMVRLSFLQRRVGYDEDSMFSLSNLLLMLLLGLLLGFHLVIVQQPTGALGLMLAAMGSAALSVYGFLLFKMLILQLSGTLFNYRRVKTLHFRAYLLFMTIFMMLLYLLELAGHWFQIDSLFYSQLIKYLGPLISTVFVIWIYFQLSSEVAKRKLHIISYLCTTEILPTFVLANWLLN